MIYSGKYKTFISYYTCYMGTRHIHWTDESVWICPPSSLFYQVQVVGIPCTSQRQQQVWILSLGFLDGQSYAKHWSQSVDQTLFCDSNVSCHKEQVVEPELAELQEVLMAYFQVQDLVEMESDLQVVEPQLDELQEVWMAYFQVRG